MKKIQKWGAIASLYEAAAYIIGMLFFIFLLDYMTIADPLEKIALFIEKQTIFYVLNLIIYIFFGVFLVILSIALFDILNGKTSALVQIATVFGCLWATIVIASGMIFNIGMETVINLYAVNPVQAGTVWNSIEAVSDGIGGGNEIVGGIWILLISIAALKSGNFTKTLNIIGIVVGLAGILSTIPPLGEIAGMIFGLVQIIWFIWLGVILLMKIR